LLNAWEVETERQEMASRKKRCTKCDRKYAANSDKRQVGRKDMESTQKALASEEINAIRIIGVGDCQN
jgi:hypothetical protein